jgi:hypothetical protein
MMRLTCIYSSMRVTPATEGETTQQHREGIDIDGQEGSL